MWVHFTQPLLGLHHAQTIQWHWPYKLVHFTNHTPCPIIKWHTRPYMWVHHTQPLMCLHHAQQLNGTHCHTCGYTIPNLINGLTPCPTIKWHMAHTDIHVGTPYPTINGLTPCPTIKWHTRPYMWVHHTQPLMGLHHTQQLNGTHGHTCGYTLPNH